MAQGAAENAPTLDNLRLVMSQTPWLRALNAEDLIQEYLDLNALWTEEEAIAAILAKAERQSILNR